MVSEMLICKNECWGISWLTYSIKGFIGTALCDTRTNNLVQVLFLFDEDKWALVDL